MNKQFDTVVQDLINEKLQTYWPDFESVAFALFDKKKVYLFNHPRMKKKSNKNYEVIKRDEQFVGCTLILYREYPTAIVDIELYKDNESLYSIVVHELFHGFQYIKGEKRFADEVLGVTYPLLKENIELRCQERTNLYYAVFAENRIKKKQFLTHFVALREKRAALINDHFLYENFVETIEGPAWYVELKSYAEKSPLAYRSLLKKYGQSLINALDSTTNLRASCYSSGLFMCLLLDEFAPDWKEHFWNKEETIYDLVKQYSGELIQINNVKISPETEKAIDVALQNRKNTIESFEQQNGIHLFIEGKITATSFDPMNIVAFENRWLHNNFLKIEMNGTDYLVQQPVIAYSKDKFLHITKLHLILQKEPTEQHDSLIVDGIGLIKGKCEKEGKTFRLYVD